MAKSRIRKFRELPLRRAGAPAVHHGRTQLPRAHDRGVLCDGGGRHGTCNEHGGGGAVPVLRPDDGRGADEHGGRAAVRQDRARLRSDGARREGTSRRQPCLCARLPAWRWACASSSCTACWRPLCGFSRAALARDGLSCHRSGGRVVRFSSSEGSSNCPKTGTGVLSSFPSAEGETFRRYSGVPLEAMSAPSLYRQQRVNGSAVPAACRRRRGGGCRWAGRALPPCPRQGAKREKGHRMVPFPLLTPKPSFEPRRPFGCAAKRGLRGARFRASGRFWDAVMP